MLGVRLGEFGDAGAIGAAQVVGGARVEGEERGGGADLCAHVGDGAATGGAHRVEAGAEVFDDRAGAALDGEFVGDAQDDVFGRGPAVEFAGQVDADQSGHGHAPAESGHHVNGVRAADADRDHAHAAGVGRVRVGADHHAAGKGVVLEDDLVDDPRARLPEAGAIAGGGAAQELVDLFVLGHGDLEVGVRADAGLNQVVAVDGGGDDDALETGELELEQRHLRGGVLEGDAVRLQRRVIHAALDRLVGRIGEVSEEDLLGQGQGAIEPPPRDVNAVSELCVCGVNAL